MRVLLLAVCSYGESTVETRRASSVSNSNFFYKTEGLRMKDGG
jgi:hypothetical protein